MSLFGDCAVKRAKYKPTTSALREYGICGFRAPDEDRDATLSSGARKPQMPYSRSAEVVGLYLARLTAQSPKRDMGVGGWRGSAQIFCVCGGGKRRRRGVFAGVQVVRAPAIVGLKT